MALTEPQEYSYRGYKTKMDKMGGVIATPEEYQLIYNRLIQQPNIMGRAMKKTSRLRSGARLMLDYAQKPIDIESLRRAGLSEMDIQKMFGK